MAYILRDYQNEAVNNALEYFRDPKEIHPVIEILPTGAGKSLIIANIAKELNEPTLVFQPTKEILEQNYKKLISYGVSDCSIFSASFNSKEISNLTFATIGSVNNCNPEIFKHFKNIIVDECFPAFSLVDGRPIVEILEGDLIKSYNHNKNIVEYKKVTHIFRRRIHSNLVKIYLSDNTSVVCTDNHPIYTNEFGYLPAKLLSLCNNIKITLLKERTVEQENNTSLLCLRGRVQKEKPRKEYKNLLLQHLQKNRTIKGQKKNRNELFPLQKTNHNRKRGTSLFYQNEESLLFKRMFSTSAISSFLVGGTKVKTNREMAQRFIRKDEKKQPNVDAKCKRENDKIIHRENIPIERGEWQNNKATTNVTSEDGFAYGISDSNGFGERPFPIVTKCLQGGFSRPTEQISHRDRRGVSQIEEMEIFRPTKNGSVECLGVESCEIFERGSGEWNREMRGEDFVYNLEVEDNNNYFVNNILVHNCHYVNSKGGMYKKFFEVVGEKIIGLTATPYRLTTDGFGGSILKFITRTRPRIFYKVIYHIQTGKLFDQGFLSKLEYSQINGFDSHKLRLNSTGADYTDESVKSHYKEINFQDKLVRVVARLLEINRKNILIFTRFTDESDFLVDKFRGVVQTVSAQTKQKERDEIINGFKKGEIKAVTNVGVLTHGFDFPELETVVLARPTRSLALYYQMSGRAIRPHPEKEKAMIIDMCQNYNRFGKLEDLKLVEPKYNLWHIESNGKQLTNVYYE